MRKTSSFMNLTAATLLAACGGGSDGGGDDVDIDIPSEAACRSIGGGGATVTEIGVGAPSQLTGAAIDGDFDTFATVTIDNAGTSTLRARPQSGVAFTAGMDGGVLFERPDTALVGMRAYLGEAAVASCEVLFFGPGNAQVTGPCRMAFRDNIGFFGVAPATAFDSLEISLQTAGEPAFARIFEFCTRDAS